jgi:hypothetical protein
MALDSLRAAIQQLALAPAGHRRSFASSIPNLLDGFIAEWNAERKAAHRRMFWRLDRRVDAIADTLGVVSLARSDFEYTGGAHPTTRVRLVSVDADSGGTLRFDHVFRYELRDSLDATLAPIFRAARGMAPDSNLAAAGFSFADSVFHTNDNFALVATGVRWHFDPGEVGSEALGPTDFVAPYDLVRAFAREGGPLWPKGR